MQFLMSTKSPVVFENTFFGAIGQSVSMIACPHLYKRGEKYLSFMILIVMVKWLLYV